MLTAVLAASLIAGPKAQSPEHRGTFVTTLGADTVAIETYVRSDAQLEGDIVLRVPGTVHFHYRLTFAKDGSVRTSAFEVKPVGSKPVEDQRRLSMTFDNGSAHIVSMANGEQQVASRPADLSPNVWFLGGYGSSFGIYGSYGMYEHLLTRVKESPSDTTALTAFSAATGEASKRLFKRPNATTAELDYFTMAWIHVILNDQGEITSADASETTERTSTKRVDSMDVGQVEKDFAALDKAGKGIGVASPNQETKASVKGASVVLKYGSPRLRGRSGVMSALVAAGRVWRTGANEATVIELSRDMIIGGQRVAAGKYSLWTLPGPSGVQLIINRETGQWGTAYKAAQDLVRLPMTVTRDPENSPVENFSITVQAKGDAAELRIQWDTFVWSVSMSPASK